MQNSEKLFFEQAWKRLMKLQKNKPCNVKQSCVRELISPILAEILVKARERGIELDESDMITLVPKLTEYIFYFNKFHLAHLDEAERKEQQHSDIYKEQVIYNISETFLLNEFVPYQVFSETATTSPEILGYNLFADFLLEYHKAANKDNMEETKAYVLGSLFQIALLTVRSITNLTGDGMDINAIVLWRHLHELECTIILLNQCDTKVSEQYFNHQNFFKLEYEQNEEIRENIDRTLKEQMKRYNLNKKQEREFINYGWLLSIDKFRELYANKRNLLKLNFKNGIQRYIGLRRDYGKYSLASKYIHPTGYMLNTDPEKAYLFIIECLDETLWHIADEFCKWLETYNLVDEKQLELVRERKRQWLDKFDQNLTIIRDRYNVKNNQVV